jgi:hypothetical protein
MVVVLCTGGTSQFRAVIKVDRYADKQERASTRYAEEARFASE